MDRKTAATDRDLVAGLESPAELAVALLSAIPDCVKLLDLDGRLTSMSHAGLCAMEIDDFAPMRGRDWLDFWPEAARPTVAEAVALARAGGDARFTAFCPTAKGSPRWWDVSVTPLRDARGRIVRLVSVSRDVTGHVAATAEVEARRSEAEAALERTRLLLLEVSHRVKNNLALIVGLLRLQMRRTADGATLHALTETAARVQTVARIHDRLYRSTDFETVALHDHLGPLCDDLDGAMGGDGRARLEATLEPLAGPVDLAVALGLIVAELVANAHRHAGLGPDGRIRVSLSRDGEDRARLSVEDDGAGLPDGFAPEAASGIGLRIVQAKAEELGADFSWARRPSGGAAFAVAFPLAAPAPTTPAG